MFYADNINSVKIWKRILQILKKIVSTNYYAILEPTFVRLIYYAFNPNLESFAKVNVLTKRHL